METTDESAGGIVSATEPGRGENGSLPLTKRHLEVLSRLASGDTFAQAAEHLSISPRTIEKHVEELRERLSARNTQHAIAIAVRDGLIAA